ncbi:MAG: rhombosortase [Gammaproteobacteria bacterium]|nr:rhombosortase [Gammaproteobacteria bacterium]
MKNFQLQHWILPICIVVIAIFNTGFQNTTETWLRYDRVNILEGELWRIFSAHMMHLTWNHLFMNLAGLLFIFFFFGNLLTQKQWLGIMIFSAIFISLILLWTQPELRWYVGLSGVLHGLFIAGGIADIKVRPKEAFLFLAFIIGKLAYEQLMGPLPGSEESAGGPVLVDAHFYGAIAGLIFMLILNGKKFAQNKPG